MKVRWRILACSVLLLAIAFGLSKARLTNKSPDQPLPNVEATVATNHVGSQEGPLAVRSDSAAPTNRFEALRGIAQRKNVPINFWGKVVDQDNRPLASAKIDVRIRQWGQSAEQLGTFESFDRLTDADGMFSVLGKSGDVITIEEISKNGYELPKVWKKSFGFNVSENVAPTKDGPIIFKMWKKGEPQILKAKRLNRLKIPCDGTPLFVDLETGQLEQTPGSLRISFLRDPIELPSVRNVRYDWRADFAMPAGGLQQALEELGNIAPDEGYKSVLSFSANKADANWQSILQTNFYFVTKGGGYGQIRMHLDTHYQTPVTGLSLEILFNPSGSRSLQR
jgi:hypothetical protein